MRGSRTEDVAPFDSWAATYDRHWARHLLFGRIHAQVVREAAQTGNPPERILDLGSGTGMLLRALGRRFPKARLSGIDPAPGMVAQANQRSEGSAGVTCVQGSASRLPFADQSFQLVVSTSSFHHWDDQPQGLSEARRVLSRDGTFILADGCKGAGPPRPHLGLLPKLLNSHRDDPERFHAPDVLRRLLEAAGFRVVTQRRLRWTPGGILLTRAVAT